MDKNLKKILIKTKKGVFSSHIGNNSSKFKGDGYDFVELREYEDGEDIRKIDWVISAKMRKPFVKVFHTQRQLEISIVPIMDGAVTFGTSRLKKDLIVEICAILGYATVSSSDSFDSFIANEDVMLNTKKSKKINDVQMMCEKLYDYNPLNKKVDFKNIVDSLYKKIKKKSIVFLIGDFLTINSIDLKLLSKKHELMVIIVRDRFEENPLALGNVNLIDPSTAEAFNGNISNSLVKEYKQKVKEKDGLLYKSLRKLAIPYTKVYTDENPLVNIIKLLR